MLPSYVTPFSAMSEYWAWSASGRLIASMALFCTRLPIQSCAPMTMSGPFLAVLAVTKLVCRSG